MVLKWAVLTFRQEMPCAYVMREYGPAGQQQHKPLTGKTHAQRLVLRNPHKEFILSKPTNSQNKQ